MHLQFKSTKQRKITALKIVDKKIGPTPFKVYPVYLKKHACNLTFCDNLNDLNTGKFVGNDISSSLYITQFECSLVVYDGTTLYYNINSYLHCISQANVLILLSLSLVLMALSQPCKDLDPHGCRNNPDLCLNQVLALVTCPVTCNKCKCGKLLVQQCVFCFNFGVSLFSFKKNM